VGFGILYCVLALAILVRDVPYFRPFFTAAKESWTDPGGGSDLSEMPEDGSDP
jgi:hypothetical protein